MIDENAKLNIDTLDKSALKSEPTRDGFGKGLVDAGEKDERVVVLCADLAESTRTHWFAEKFPERYIELGVAEQNLATVASGLANYGKIPFIASYATFSPGRNNEQIRTTVALNNVPVKIVGAHAGISVGPDGATHQALEDMALMRVIPNMVVINPCDAIEARKATIAAVEYDGPIYIRLARDKTPVFTTEESPFEIGKAQVVFRSKEGIKNKVGIVSCGTVVHNAILAANELESGGVGVSVINLATIKPIDKEAIINFAKSVDLIVTVEEHQVAGGMGSAIAEILSQNYPMKIKMIGVNDRFGQSGTTDELIEHYNLDVASIVRIIKELIV